jgi:tetratricopeptide (TPR) repeat protein
MTQLEAEVREIACRPQPAGIFPFPAGLLILPSLPCQENEALDRVLAADLTNELPTEWSFFAAAVEKDFARALAELGNGEDAISRYNRFVLRPSPETYWDLKPILGGGLGVLLDLVAFSHGYIDEPPGEDSLDGELLALLLMVRASWRLEQEDPQGAIRVLENASAAARPASPLLAAQIFGQLAELRRSTPGQGPARVIQDYRAALQLASGTALDTLRAELWINLGMCYQEAASGQRGALLEAVKAYQEAVHAAYTLERNPEMYALAQNNIALAYLSIPASEASDQLRMGIAVQAFREALKVYGKETHTEMWASVQLNLANALQYLPSSHPQENLIQAVEIYEELLPFRNKAFDPLGYARLLANQANALAHLGIFAPALEKLTEAHKLFHWHNEPEAAASILEMVDRINESIARSSRPE